MTDDELALLRNINANPDDDLPRLVYADWLDEHDRPIRAEFIRVQCELAQVEATRQAMKVKLDTTNEYDFVQLKRRIRELKKRSKQLSLEPILLQEIMPAADFDLISRGFMSKITTDFNSVLTGVENWPMFDSMVVKPSIKAWATIAHLVNTRLSTSRLEYYYSYMGELGLSRRENYADSRISRLFAKYFHTDESLMTEVFQKKFLKFDFPRLKRLSTHRQLEDAEFRILCERLQAPRLEVWFVSSTNLTDHALSHLANAVFAPTLQLIKLNFSQVTAEGLRQLAPTKFPRLKKIIVGQHTPASNDLDGLRALHPQIEYVG